MLTVPRLIIFKKTIPQTLHSHWLNQYFEKETINPTDVK